MAATKVGTVVIDVDMNTSRLASGVGQVNKQMNKMAGSIGKSMGKAKGHLSGFQTFFKQIAHYISFSIGVQLVMGIRRAFEAIIDIFKTYEKAIYNAAAVSGYLGEAFDDAVVAINNLTHELAKNTIFTISEVSEAMYSLASAGIDPVTTSVGDLEPILHYAQATQTELKDALYATLVAMKQFNMGLEESQMMVDSWTALITNSFMTMEKFRDAFRYTGQIAGTLDQDFMGLNAAITLLGDRGYEGAQAGQRLNMIFTKLLSPTDKAKRMLARLGLEISDIDPTTKNLVEILHILSDAGFEASDATDMFRARTAAAAITLVDSVDAIEDYIMMQKQLGGITESIAEKQMETLDATFKQLRNAAEELAVAIGDKLADSLQTLLDVGGMVVDELGSMLEDVGIEIDTKAFGVDWLMMANPITAFLELMGFVKREVVAPMKAVEAWMGGLRAFNDLRKDGMSLTEAKIKLDSIENKNSQEYADALATYNDILENGTTMFEDSAKATTNYMDAIREVNEIKSEMASLDRETTEGAERYNQLNQQLINANIALADSESEVIKSSNEILDTMINMDTEIANGIAAYKNLTKANLDLNRVEEDIRDLEEERTEVQTTMNELTTAGKMDTIDYVNANNRLVSIENQLIDLNTKKSNIQDTVTAAQNKYNDVLNAANGISKEYIELAAQIIDITGQLYQAQSDYTAAFNEYTRLLDKRENQEKYLSEAMLDVYDLQDKLFEIESKRFSLQQEKNDLDDEMFDNLAEQGLLTEEIIQEYKEWQIAEGELAKARAAFARGEITEEELQAYIAAAASEQEDYNTLLYGSEDALAEYLETGEGLPGIVGHFIDIGAAGGDIVSTFFDMLDLQNDNNQLTHDWALTFGDLQSALEKVADLEDIEGIDLDIELAKDAADGFFQDIQDLVGELGAIEVTVELQTDKTEMPDYRGEGTKASMGFIAGFMEKFGFIINPIVNTFMKIVNFVMPIFQKIVDFIVPMWNKFVEAATTAWNVITSIAMPVIGAIKTVVGTIWTVFKEVAYTAWSVINSIAVPIIEGIINLLKPVWEVFSTAAGIAFGLIKTVATPIFDALKKIAGTIFEVFGTIWSRVSGILKMVREIASKIGAGIRFVFGGSAEGGIMGLQKGITMTKGPQLSLIGEAGPEAVVPLAGANKKYGEEILRHILPEYFPDIMNFQTGGMVGGGSTTTNSYATDNYNITGPITVVSSSPANFMEQMKYQFRSSSRR